MNKYEIKAWFKSKSKKYWVLTGIIGAFIILALISSIVAMYMTGYTLISWFAKFGWIVLIVLGIIAIIALGLLFIKMRKR